MWWVLEELITDDICTVYSYSAPFIPMSPLPGVADRITIRSFSKDINENNVVTAQPFTLCGFARRRSLTDCRHCLRTPLRHYLRLDMRGGRPGHRGTRPDSADGDFHGLTDETVASTSPSLSVRPLT